MNVGANPYDDRWCAVQVTPRHEATVSAILRNKGYEQFLPTYRVKRQWSDRRKEISVPLFTGYVFCRLNSKIPWSIVTTPGVIRIVGTRKGIALIDDREIEAIQLVMKAGLKVEPATYAKIGDRVRITNGPLSGVEGIVTMCKNQHRLVVSVELIQSSVAVEIDGYNLMPVSSTSTQSTSVDYFPTPQPGQLQTPNPLPLAG
jgi:transcription termination/antitermination protein NusG